MKEKTITLLTEGDNMNKKLINAVIRQTGCSRKEFREMAIDVNSGGASGGFCGFIYYTDTLSFYKRNRQLIIEQLQDDAQEIYGNDDVLTMVKGFKCCKDAMQSEIAQTLYSPITPKLTESDFYTQIANCLAWYSLEVVSRTFEE